MKSLSILGLVSTAVSAYQDNGVLETRNVHEVMLADMKHAAVEGVKDEIHN
jgi:hypothetical protein